MNCLSKLFRRGADFVVFGGPEAGGVGREDFVHQADLPFGVDAELELRVGDDDALRRGVFARAAVEFQRGVADGVRDLFP